MSKSVSLLLVLLLLTSSHLIVSLPVKADRTLVVPDDYPTISSAIGNAVAGDTILVREGSYEGPVNQTIVIDKTLSIVGENAENTIIKLYPAYNVSWILTAAFFSYSDAITINADNVKLSNLTIFLSNPGGYITVNGDMTQIVSNNIIAGSEVGLVVQGSYCNITDNIPIGSSRFFNLGGYESSGGSISLSGVHNIIARNSFHRITINKDFNTISNNSIHIVELSNANNNVIYRNNITTTTTDYGLVNFWDNGEEGNYWEDYNGTDANGDGIGDTPYIIDDKNVDNYPLMYPYDTENDNVSLPPSEPFPTMLVAAVATAVFVGVGLLVYFRRRRQ